MQGHQGKEQKYFFDLNKAFYLVKILKYSLVEQPLYEIHVFKSISGSRYDPAGSDPPGLQKSLKGYCGQNFRIRDFKF